MIHSIFILISVNVSHIGMASITFRRITLRLCEFLKLNSCHGFKYLASTKLHWLEFCFWLSAICCLFSCQVYIAYQTWMRYTTANTVVAIDKDFYVYNTSFPAITVCQVHILDDKKLDSFVATLSIPVYDREVAKQFLKNMSEVNLLSMKYAEFSTSLDHVHPKDYNTLFMKLLKGVSLGAVSSLGKMSIERTITELGICYTFNNDMEEYFTTRQWHDTNFQLVATDRTLTCNYYDLKPVQATIFSITETLRVMVHSPFDVPTVWNWEGSAGVDDTGNTDLYLYPKGTEIGVADNFEKTSIQQRHCRYPHESNLTYFPIYTYNLCHQDCRIKKCLELCGCIPFFYVNDRTAKLPVCGPSGIRCLGRARTFIIALRNTKDRSSKISCYCLRSCNDVRFVVSHTKILPTIFSPTIYIEMLEFSQTRYVREVIFTFEDLIVSIGSALGLFLGASLLSQIEILYFFTVRLYLGTIRN